MRRFACLLALLVPGCSLYFDPSGTPDDGGLPAGCDHPEYRAQIFEPMDGANVTDPVRFRWRLSPSTIPNPYIKITDQWGYDGAYGEWSMQGLDTLMTVTEEPNTRFTVEVGWYCFGGGNHNATFPLARASFTVLGTVVDAGPAPDAPPPPGGPDGGPI